MTYDFIERLVAKFLIWRLRVGYGADCETSDLDDQREMYLEGKLSESVIHQGRCASCRAAETIAFLEEHRSLLKF